jgi:hypothetical protein
MIIICSIIFDTNLFCKCLTLFDEGGSIKLNMMGISKRESINKLIIFKEAIIPNCFKISLFTIIKVANPEAVVRFVKKVALPIFIITR